MRSKTHLFLFLTCLILATATLAQNSIASKDWSLYVSETQLFSVLLPKKSDETVSTFRIGDGLMLHNSEVLSFIDQRPYKNIIKNYIIKFDQTFGPSISKDFQKKIVERELDLYLETYDVKNAKVIDREIEGGNNRTIGEISLLYDDVDEGLQAARIKIIVTPESKFHQVFSGPEKDLRSKKTEQYFESLNIESGIASVPGSINEDWRRIESPKSLFAIKIPPITPPYFSNEPSVTTEKKQERIGMVFTDPIWAQNVYYSVTGYQLEAEMSFELAKEALLEKHMKRHGRNEVGVTFNKDFIVETPYIETHYAIHPPKGLPYLNKVRLRAMFLGNYMIVQEIVGANHLIQSPFVEDFYNLIEFTPKKAFQKELQNHLNANIGNPTAQ